MTTNIYEDTYVCVSEAKYAAAHVTEVAEFLKQQVQPLSCKEIGQKLFGDRYVGSISTYRNIGSAELGHILRHLARGRFVKVDYVYGEPITVSERKWVPIGIPLKIKVHDDEGNTYFIDNPAAYDAPQYEWRDIERIVTPKTRVYSWVKA